MKVRLLVSEAWRSLGANLSTTFAAMMTVLIGMFLLGLLIALGTWTVSWSNHVKRELLVKVDFTTSSDRGGQATHAEENAVARKLSSEPARRQGRLRLEGAGARRDEEESSPSSRRAPVQPPSGRVRGHTQERRGHPGSSTRASTIRSRPGVNNVIDGKVYSNRILHFARVIEIIFLIAIAILLTSASLLIANTIRLSIFSRRREIEVMKLVGATNWFVRGPFMIEGLFCGLGGAVLAVGLLEVGKAVALPAILHNALSTDSDVHALAF